MQFSDTAIVIIDMVVVSTQTCQYSSDKYLAFGQKAEVNTGDKNGATYNASRTLFSSGSKIFGFLKGATT